MPKDTKTIRSFLGLCNFFRGNIKDYATLSSPLNRLLRKDSLYSGALMPSDAQESFTRLKRILCSRPVLAFPSPDKQYALFVDTSTEAKDFKGGLGAILTQMDAHGRFWVSWSSPTPPGCCKMRRRASLCFSWKREPWFGLLATSGNSCAADVSYCSWTTSH